MSLFNQYVDRFQGMAARKTRVPSKCQQNFAFFCWVCDCETKSPPPPSNLCTGAKMMVRVVSPEPSLTLMVRVSPGETLCKFGGRVWCIDWSGGATPIKLTTLQTVKDFASDAADPRLGTQRLTMSVMLGKKVIVMSDLGPMQSKLTFTMEAQDGGDPTGLRAVPRAARGAFRAARGTLRGVIILRDQVLCTNEYPDVPGVVSDWRAVDEEAYPQFHRRAEV
jgi:hypothetical protein